jgi:zinc-ribbon domain
MIVVNYQDILVACRDLCSPSCSTLIHFSKPSHSIILDGMVRLISYLYMKRFFMRKWVLPLILILTTLLPLGVRAETPLVLSTMQIGIWPEFDKPSVLVIYQMTLSASTTYPATVSLRIPIAAGEPNAVAARQVDGSLFTIKSTRQVSGEWATITFTATSPDLQLEYYDPGLTKEGNARHYQYDWPGDYAVTQLTIQVQQPTGATDTRISPSLGTGAAGTDNLTYFTQDIGAITAGQNFHITIDYQKTSDVLSSENLPVQPNAPIPQGKASDLNLSTWLPWILGILGAGLIVGGIVWYWQTGRQRPLPQTRRRRSKAEAIESEPSSTSTEPLIYCSQCGKRALPGDQFCRSCGTPIRSK